MLRVNHLIGFAARTQAGVLWTPSNLSVAAAVWVKSNDLATITETSGDVSSVSNKGSLGGSFSKGGTTLRTGDSTLDGKNILDFTAAYLTSSLAASNFNFLHNGTKHHVFAVVRFGTGSDPNAFYGLFGTNATSSANRGGSAFFDDRASVPRNNGISHIITRATTPNVVDNYSGNDFITPNTFHLYDITADPAKGTASARSKHRLNADTIASNNSVTGAHTTSNATYTLQLGATGNNTGPATMSLAEIVFLGYEAPTNEIERIQGYMAWEWGLEGSLPGGHAYKSAAPTV